MLLFGVNGLNTDNGQQQGGMFLLTEAATVTPQMSVQDAQGWNSVGVQLEVALTDRQIRAIRQKFGTKTIDVPKCQRVYDAIRQGKTNAEISRAGDFKARRIADIRAAVAPGK